MGIEKAIFNMEQMSLTYPGIYEGYIVYTNQDNPSESVGS